MTGYTGLPAFSEAKTDGRGGSSTSTQAAPGNKMITIPRAEAMADYDVVLAPVHTTWLCGKCEGSGMCTLPGCSQVRTIRASRPAKTASPTSDGDKAMAVGSSKPSALDVSEEWLCDTGAAYDLVPRDDVDQYTDFQSSAPLLISNGKWPPPCRHHTVHVHPRSW